MTFTEKIEYIKDWTKANEIRGDERAVIASSTPKFSLTVESFLGSQEFHFLKLLARAHTHTHTRAINFFNLQCFSHDNKACSIRQQKRMLKLLLAENFWIDEFQFKPHKFKRQLFVHLYRTFKLDLKCL